MSSKLVFVSGASSGIGQALAMRFHQAGYRVAMLARHEAPMRDWAQRQGWADKHYGVYAADVTQVDSMVAAARDCMTRQGLPDVVIASAGISVGVDTAIREDIDVMAQVFAVNNVGMAATFHPFLDGMRARGSGVLVGIASVNGIRGFPGHGAYCASKAGVIRYCESLRGELRGTGVQVTTLCPGYIDTPLTRGNRYRMPFLLQPAEFAQRAYRSIAAGDSYRVIPWQMAIVAGVLRVLPNWAFDRLFAGRPRKQRAQQA